jgi:cytochrome c oxidase subunit IV
MSEHIVPVKSYMSVFVALLVLTALTTSIAFIDLGKYNTVVALVIAVCKMLLVALFFMHLRYSTGLTRILVLGALLWLGIMVTLTLSDELTRSWIPQPHPWGPSISSLEHQAPMVPAPSPDGAKP